MWRVTSRRCEKAAAAYLQTWSFVYVPDECDVPRSYHAPATSLPRTRHVATSVSCAWQPTASPTDGQPTPPPTTGSLHTHGLRTYWRPFPSDDNSSSASFSRFYDLYVELYDGWKWPFPQTPPYFSWHIAVPYLGRKIAVNDLSIYK